MKRYFDLSLKNLNSIREGLKAAGMDLDVYAPSPDSFRSSRSQYKQATAKRAAASMFFKAVSDSYSSWKKEPYIVVEKPNNEAKLKISAKQEADALDMKAQGVASRIYVWFADQPDTIRKGVLGLLPADMRDEILAMVVERMRKKKR